MRRILLAITAVAALAGPALAQAAPTQQQLEAERRRREEARRLIEGTAQFAQFWAQGSTRWRGLADARYALPAAELPAVPDAAGREKEVADLIAVFPKGTVPEKMEARNTLVKIGPPAVKALAEALRSTDSAVRSSAQTVLEKIGAPAMSAVLELTDVDEQPVRSAALAVVQKAAAREHLGAIVAKAESAKHDDCRAGLVAAVRRILGPKDVEAALAMLTGAKDLELRRAAAATLVGAGEMKALPAFVEMGKSTDAETRKLGVAGVAALAARCGRDDVAMLYAAFQGTQGELKDALARPLQKCSGRNPAGEPENDWKFMVFVKLTNADWPPAPRY